MSTARLHIVLACASLSAGCFLLNATEPLPDVCFREDGTVDCRGDCVKLPECGAGERDPSACGNGVDDDGDQRIDCEDDGCFEFVACFHRIPLARSDECPLAEPGAYVFLGERPDQPSRSGATFWEVASGDIVPTLSSTAALAFEGPGVFSIVRSNTTFRFGAARPLSLSYTARFDTQDRRDNIFLGVMFAVEGTTASLFNISASISAQQIALSCEYRRTPGDSRILTRSENAPLLVRVETRDDRLIVSTATDTRAPLIETCDVGPLDPLERRVRLHVGVSRFRPAPRLVIETLELAVGADDSTKCGGMGEIDLADYCRSGVLQDLVLVGPKLHRMLRAPDGFHAFTRLGVDSSELLWMHVKSEDGRRWRAIDERDPFLRDRDIHAAVWDARSEAILAWTEDFAHPPELIAVPVDGPPRWESRGTLEGEWVPRAVMPTAGGFLGWRDTAERTVEVASSPDGLRWSPPALALAGGGIGAWDREGIDAITFDPGWVEDYSMSVQRVSGDFYLMAYSGLRFPELSALGLATSTDGYTWTRHVQNPIFDGRGDGFDYGGIFAPHADFDGQLLRVWLAPQVITAEPPCAPNARGTRGHGIGFVEFTQVEP